MKPFLTATWSHLLNLTYRVPPALLQPHVPAGTTLEVQEGSAFVSLVAFDFLDTRVRGIKIPFHVDFPEINLRFYLRQGEQRGVAFLKELVPRPAIAWVARGLYNEPYEAARMISSLESSADGFTLRHAFRYRRRPYLIQAQAADSLSVPDAESIIHFFKEHEWGYGVDRKGRTLCYQVKHPVWEVFDLRSFCACLAKGSKIEVYPPFLLTE
jgi:uncharacterized protein